MTPRETEEDQAVVIDLLANDRDPDGDRLQVVAVASPVHGTTTVADGGVQRHGRVSYTVADAGGLTARAMVTVEVLPVNHPPEAEDDEAETLEDKPVIVDVLANDWDPDGDRLHVVSVTAPAHGTAAVVPGGVQYSPARDYHGSDAFTYTVADPRGLTATARAALTVLPVNDAPAPVGAIPDQALEESGEPVTLDVAPFFTDVDGDALAFTSESSDPQAASVAVSGRSLTLTPVVTGAAVITVTATDPGGLTATQVFGVAVGDRLVREVLTDTMAALGRGHLSSVRQTVGRRLDGGGSGTRRLMVAGQQLDPGAWDRLGAGGLTGTHALLTRAALFRQRVAGSSLVRTPADPHLQRLATSGGFTGRAGLGPCAPEHRRAADVRAGEPDGGGRPAPALDGLGPGRPAGLPGGASRDARVAKGTCAPATWGSTPRWAAAGCSAWQCRAAAAAARGRRGRPRGG